MSITMKLDTPAVRALIKEDEKFALELQAAVIAEIVRGMFDKSVPGELKKVIDGACTDQLQLVKKALEDDQNFRNYTDKAIKALVQSIRNGSVGYLQQRVLTDEVKRLIDAHITSQIAEPIEAHKEEMGRKVDAMIMRMEQRFEQEIEGKIAKMDKAYYDIAYRTVMEKFVSFATS
jgi:hypothetical protein